MAPAAHTTETPANGDAANGAGITLGVRFTVSEELDIGAVPFYAPTTNTGTYTAGLWQTTADDDPNGDGAGTLLESGSAAAGSVNAGAWNDIPLDAPVTCSPGVVYTAGVHTSSGQFVLTTSFYNSNSLTGNGVTLLQAGTDPNPPGLGSMLNGVFTEGGALAYPATGTNSDYFIDVALAEDEAIAAALAVTLPALAASAAVEASATTTAAVTLPSLSAALAAAAGATVAAAVTLPALTADITAAVPIEAAITATLPALTVAFEATSAAAAPRSPFAVKRFPGVRANDTLRRTPTFRNVRRRR